MTNDALALELTKLVSEAVVQADKNKNPAKAIVEAYELILASISDSMNRKEPTLPATDLPKLDSPDS